MALAVIGPVGQALLDGRTPAEVLGFELQVRLRSLDAHGNASADFVSRTGIIDTGASHVHIDRKAAKELGLRAHDRERPVEIASGESLRAVVYTGVIEAPDLGVGLVTELYSIDEQQPNGKIIMPPSRILIGRSFLRHFLVTFDGPSGIVTFAKPSTHFGYPVDDE